MYYMHPDYQTSIFGKNCAYYIRIFTVCNIICKPRCRPGFRLTHYGTVVMAQITLGNILKELAVS